MTVIVGLPDAIPEGSGKPDDAARLIAPGPHIRLVVIIDKDMGIAGIRASVPPPNSGHDSRFPEQRVRITIGGGRRVRNCGRAVSNRNENQQQRKQKGEQNNDPAFARIWGHRESRRLRYVGLSMNRRASSGSMCARASSKRPNGDGGV